MKSSQDKGKRHVGIHDNILLAKPGILVFDSNSNSKWLKSYEFSKKLLTWQPLIGATSAWVPIAFTLTSLCTNWSTRVSPYTLDPHVNGSVNDFAGESR